ncbi:homeodomain-like protein [Tanacetum coccineum]
MIRSSTSELFTPYKELERKFRSSRRHFKTLSLDELRSPDFNLFSDQEYSEEEVAETVAETMEHDSDHEDANEHIEKVLEIVDLFHIPNITIDQVMLRAFPMSLTGASSRWLRKEPTGAIPSKNVADAKVAIQKMAGKWYNGTSRSRSTETSDRLAAIQAQPNNLGREIKKVNEKVYDDQVGCEQCKGPHYTKDCPLKEEGKTLKEAYYTQFGRPFQGGGYRAAAPGFYQRNNTNPSYQERRQSMEDTLSKFISESAKRHEENSYLIKEI